MKKTDWVGDGVVVNKVIPLFMQKRKESALLTDCSMMHAVLM